MARQPSLTTKMEKLNQVVLRQKALNESLKEESKLSLEDDAEQYYLNKKQWPKGHTGEKRSELKNPFDFGVKSDSVPKMLDRLNAAVKN